MVSGDCTRKKKMRKRTLILNSQKENWTKTEKYFRLSKFFLSVSHSIFRSWWILFFFSFNALEQKKRKKHLKEIAISSLSVQFCTAYQIWNPFCRFFLPIFFVLYTYIIFKCDEMKTEFCCIKEAFHLVFSTK